ncbi:MAG: DUF6458 family protein [Actinomycetota bacterium]|nr:DUF6458 family protein [Actinomycetota bacterium]
MGIGASLFLFALGAILAWAVSYEPTGVDLNTVGVILMIAGAIGLVWALIASGRRREVR